MEFILSYILRLNTAYNRPSQLGTSTELGRFKSPSRVYHKLAPVAESESSDVVAIGLDGPFSDDVQVNISSSSFKDEGHLNVFVSQSEVGPRSSEVKVPQVEQEVVMGVGDLQSTLPTDIADVVTVLKPTTGMTSLILASSDHPDPPPDAIPGSDDVPLRPEQATQGRK